MHTDLQLPIQRSFVSPLLCHYLVEQGFTLSTPYCWKVRHGQAWLHTNAFDKDGIYMQAIANEEFASPLLMELPALETADVQLLIPDYFLSRVGAKYILSCDKMWELDDVAETRMPDVFAAMALQCFRKKILTAALAIEKIVNV